MHEGLREFDTTIGRCTYCRKMVLAKEATLSLNGVAHSTCKMFASYI